MCYGALEKPGKEEGWFIMPSRLKNTMKTWCFQFLKFKFSATKLKVTHKYTECSILSGKTGSFFCTI